MGGQVGLADWFLPAYIGFFAFTGLVALALVVAVARRPRDRFPGSWAAPKTRWVLVPAVFLALLAFQAGLVALAALPGRAAFDTVTVAIKPGAALLGLATIGLALATLVEGVAYPLRVVYPAPGRGSVQGEDASADGSSDDPRPKDRATKEPSP